MRYALVPDDGKEYKSPSSIGTAVTGKACNGWAFWSVDTDAASETTAGAQSEEPDFTPTAHPTEVEALEAVYVVLEDDSGEPPAANFRRVPNQRGVDEGQVRLYCDTCGNSFIVPEGKNPETCPMGHQAR